MSKHHRQRRRSVVVCWISRARTRVRWYFYTNAAPWLPNRFHAEADCTRRQRKFMGTLWNTYAFFILYAEIDQFRSRRRIRLDKVRADA